MKIAVFPFPLLAHYLRCAELLREHQGNHQIFFAGSNDAATIVERMGFELFQSDNFDPATVLEHSHRFDFGWLTESAILRVLESQISSIKQLSPDLIISDASQVTRMAAEFCNVKHLSLVNAYMTHYYAEMRGLPEGHPAKKYESQTPKPIFNWMTRIAESMAMKKVHKPFLSLRKKFELPVTQRYLDEYEGDIVGILDAPEVFPLHRAPKHYVPLGPVYYDSTPLRAAPPNSLSRIIVTLGSSGEWPQIELLDDPVFHSFQVVALGKAGPLLRGSHIERIPFAEPDQILPGAKAVICHGGNGSIYQALSYGVPVLCHPSMFEQEWNVARFEALGLVRRIPTNLSPVELLQLIEEGNKPAGFGHPSTLSLPKNYSLHPAKKRFGEVLREVTSACSDDGSKRQPSYSGYNK